MNVDHWRWKRVRKHNQDVVQFSLKEHDFDCRVAAIVIRHDRVVQEMAAELLKRDNEIRRLEDVIDEVREEGREDVKRLEASYAQLEAENAELKARLVEADMERNKLVYDSGMLNARIHTLEGKKTT